MREKLVVFAMTCVLASPALAEVSINGMVNVGPFITRSGSAVPTDRASNAVTKANNQDSERYKQGFSKQGVTSNNSYINFNASAETGSGWKQLKVLFQYQLDVSDTGGSLANTGHKAGVTSLLRTRNSFVGFSSFLGTVKFGTNENLYEQYLYEADPMDNAAGIGGNLQLFGTPGYGVIFDVGQMEVNPQYPQAGFYRRTDQNIWYEIPNFKGFSAGVSISLNAFQKEARGEQYISGSTKPRVISAGAQFKPAFFPFYVNVAYERHDDLFGLNSVVGNPNNGENSIDTGMKVQAGVTVRFVTVGGIVEQLQYTIGNNSAGKPSAANFDKYSRLAYGVHGKISLPFGYIGGAYGMALNGKYRHVDDVNTEDVNEGANTGTAAGSRARYLSLGYFHYITPSSQFQVMGTMVDNDVNASYGIPSGATANLKVAGADHQALYMGIKYSF